MGIRNMIEAQPTFVVVKTSEERKPQSLSDNVTKFKLSEFSEPKRSKSPNPSKPQTDPVVARHGRLLAVQSGSQNTRNPSRNSISSVSSSHSRQTFRRQQALPPQADFVRVFVGKDEFLCNSDCENLYFLKYIDEKYAALGSRELEIIPEKVAQAKKLDSCEVVFDFCDKDGNFVGLTEQSRHARATELLKTRT